MIPPVVTGEQLWHGDADGEERAEDPALVRPQVAGEQLQLADDEV